MAEHWDMNWCLEHQKVIQRELDYRLVHHWESQMGESWSLECLMELSLETNLRWGRRWGMLMVPHLLSGHSS